MKRHAILIKTKFYIHANKKSVKKKIKKMYIFSSSVKGMKKTVSYDVKFQILNRLMQMVNY